MTRGCGRNLSRGRQDYQVNTVIGLIPAGNGSSDTRAAA